MTHIFQDSYREQAKWRKQADRAAKALKEHPLKNQPEQKLGFVFDDAVVTLIVKTDTILGLNEQALADHIYTLVVTAVRDAKGQG